MGNIAEKLNIDLSRLSSEEKAALAHFLIEELDGDKDLDAEGIWRKEAEKRYKDYKSGHISSVSDLSAFEKARKKLA